jgi:hypothetical protein
MVIGIFFCFDRLEPLVFRIKEKRSAILCPGIDMISEQNMAYGVSDVKNIFYWNYHFEFSRVRVMEV